MNSTASAIHVLDAIRIIAGYVIRHAMYVLVVIRTVGHVLFRVNLVISVVLVVIRTVRGARWVVLRSHLK